MLGATFGVRSSESDYCILSCIHDVDTNDHGVLHGLGHHDLVQILLKLGVYLLQNVGINSDLSPLYRAFQDEL